MRSTSRAESPEDIKEGPVAERIVSRVLSPGSLPPPSGDHSSARHDPRRSGRLLLRSEISACPCLALHQVGFTVRLPSPRARCALNTPFHPYRRVRRRFAFCGTFLRVTPTCISQAPCPVEPGLSSTCGPEGPDRDHLSLSTALLGPGGVARGSGVSQAGVRRGDLRFARGRSPRGRARPCSDRASVTWSHGLSIVKRRALGP